MVRRVSASRAPKGRPAQQLGSATNALANETRCAGRDRVSGQASARSTVRRRPTRVRRGDHSELDSRLRVNPVADVGRTSRTGQAGLLECQRRRACYHRSPEWRSTTPRTLRAPSTCQSHCGRSARRSRVADAPDTSASTWCLPYHLSTLPQFTRDPRFVVPGGHRHTVPQRSAFSRSPRSRRADPEHRVDVRRR